ncbi:MAG: hypothetical protein ACFFCW_01395 [Candidatus Hodarchaeota archaeon]
MALLAGDNQASEGMSKAIFEEMDDQLSPPLKKVIDEAEDDDVKEKAREALEDARKNWKKLSFCIAKGVIEHIESKMEIKEIHTKGDVTTHIDIQTSRVNGHRHRVKKDVTASGVTFTQSDDGTGHVA